MLVKFEVDDSAHLGDRTEAAVKTKSLLGSRILEVVPRGDGDLSAPIPIERTTPPYQLSDALGDLATTVDQLDTGTLSQSLDTLAQTFANTPPDLQAAVAGTIPLLTVAQPPRRPIAKPTVQRQQDHQGAGRAQRSGGDADQPDQRAAGTAPHRKRCPRSGFGQSVYVSQNSCRALWPRIASNSNPRWTSSTAC